MSVFPTLFVSNFLKMPVRDRLDNLIGNVKDIIVALDKFPRVTKLVINNKGKKYILPWNSVQSFNSVLLRLNLVKNELTSTTIADNEILLAKDLLDMQIFDVHGHKVVRVNDIQLSQINNDVCMVSADVGFRGMMRRLGMEHFIEQIANVFGIKIPDHLISGDLVAPIKPGNKNLYLTVPYQHMSNMHPADIADMISELNAKERSSIIEFLDEEVAADVVPELSASMQVELIKSLNEEKAADILEEMSPDEAVDLLQDMPKQKTERLLSLMEKEEAEDVRELMSFDEDVAGGLMNNDFVSFNPEFTAEDTIKWIRENKPEADMIYYIYVTDKDDLLMGVLSLRRLIIAQSDKKLRKLMNPVITVGLNAKRKEIAKLMIKYTFLAVPVVDENNILKGIVTLDDAISEEDK